MPEERLFTEQQEEPKASVFLNVMPGESLQRKQIQAIQHLVAHSVQGLQPENITILDQYANPLAIPMGPYMDTAELSSSQFELRSQVERHFQRKIQHVFDRVLGPGKSVVSVSVDLDFDSIERTEEKYDPDSAVVRSEERQRESTVSPAGQVEGVAGVSANLPTVAPLTSVTGISGPKREASSTVTNYEISKTIEHIIKSPSTIKSLSASVVVDGSYEEVAAPDGTVTKEYIPRSEEEMEKYRRMVLATLGNPTTRTAEVINVPLEVPPSELEYGTIAREHEMRDLYLMLAKGIITIILLAVIFLVVRYILRRALPATALFPREELGARVDMVADEDIDPLMELREMLDERPEVLASIIKAWVKEED
jgi:flagellar M-ring protein FliF